MKRYSAALATLTGLFVAGGLGAGCTLLNTFGDVEPLKEAGSDDGTTADVASDVTTDGPAADASSDGGDAGPQAAPPGLIVIGGAAVTEGGEELVLTALDPATGSEYPRAREAMVVSAVQYDGARGIWYIFESGGQGIFPLPTDSFYLHTRTFDKLKGVWTELGKVEIPPGLSFATTAALNGRVLYVAYGEGDAGVLDGGYPSSFSLVTLDTSNPAAVTLESTYPLWSSPASLVGLRLANGSQGGRALLGASVRVGAASYAQLTPVDETTSSPNEGVPIVGTVPVGGLTGFGVVTDPMTRDITYAMTVGRTSGAATVSIFDPLLSDPTYGSLKLIGAFPFGDSNVKNPAFSDCDQTAFVVGTNSDLSVYAVSLAGRVAPGDVGPDAGPPMLSSTHAATGHSGQGVYFEPYTKTVITPFSQGMNFALTAFKLGGTPTSPTLVQRVAPEWVPPADVRPNFIGTAIPYPPVCSVGGDP